MQMKEQDSISDAQYTIGTLTFNFEVRLLISSSGKILGYWRFKGHGVIIGVWSYDYQHMAIWIWFMTRRRCPCYLSANVFSTGV